MVLADLKIGQRWKTRQGKTVIISDIWKEDYEGETVFQADNGFVYWNGAKSETAYNLFTDGTAHREDLVELLSE